MIAAYIDRFNVKNKIYVRSDKLGKHNKSLNLE